MLDMPGSARANDPDAAGRLQPSQGPARSFGTGCVAGVLRPLDIPDIALNPGAGFHGLHDGRVNHLGSEQPRTLPCRHKEPIAAPAHRWAKMTDPPMAAVRHDDPAQAMDAVLAGAVAVMNVRVLPGSGAAMQAVLAKEAKPDRG